MSDYGDSKDKGRSPVPSPLRGGPVQSQCRAGKQFTQTSSGMLPPQTTAPAVVMMRKADGSVAAPLPFTGIPADLAAWAFHPHIPAVVPQAPVQARGDVGSPSVHEAASAGVRGTGSALPHAKRIQTAFGPVHDISHVQAHIGGAAAVASEAIGAEAYATGDHIAFRDAPDIHTAAHEAAHVIQQQQGVMLLGGVGQAGDIYERHADAVADRVVAGQSAADLLAAGPTGSTAKSAPLPNTSGLAPQALVQARSFIGAADVASTASISESTDTDVDSPQVASRPSPNGNEFESMAAYQEITGETELGPYQWLKEDRENQTGTWDAAMTKMTQCQAEDVLQPFEQVRDYYIWVTRKLDEKGHESRWVKGALWLVDELSDTYDEGYTTPGNWQITPGKDVIPMLEDLNVGIVNFAITQFHRLLYGDLKDNPLTGEDAYQFDKQFITHEQGTIAQPIYEQYAGTDAIKTMNNLFNGTGLAGNLVDGLNFIGAANEVPTHPNLLKADLTDPESNFGRDARTNVPLWMLYPDRHRSYEIDPDNPAPYPQVDRLMDLKEEDRWYRWDDDKDPNDVYESYKRVNNKIMAKEW